MLHRLPFWGILLKVSQTFNKMVLVWSLLPSSYARCKDKFGFHRIVAFGEAVLYIHDDDAAVKVMGDFVFCNAPEQFAADG